MEEDSKLLRLKEWVIVQIDSGQYEGLCWEDESRTMFRIPWKHAAKKDYKQGEDAALFKAWAVYKGKFREGRDRADPTMWKTRLRCALNKSTDFTEVPERSQLDISEPYKVYRIECDDEPFMTAGSLQMESQAAVRAGRCTLDSSNSMPTQPQLRWQDEPLEARKEESKMSVLLKEHMYCEPEGGKAHSHQSPFLRLLSPTFTISDFRMQVILFYHGQMVLDVITASADGCFILQGKVPVGNEKIYGPCRAQQVAFPSPALLALEPGIAEAIVCLLTHLEKGVLLWVAPDGVFIKRFCQCRVYWSGPMAQHVDRPNKLERERTFRLLDLPIFLKELQSYLQGNGPQPRYEIKLCFGEEFPDPSVQKTGKLITVQVVPRFAVELLQRFHPGENMLEPHIQTLHQDGGKM